MCDLDSELRAAHASRLCDHTCQRRFVVVRIKAKTAVRNAAVPFNVSCLDDDKRGAGMRQHAEMHQVPIIGTAVIGGILAHRRDHDTIGKLEARQTERREQVTGHGINSTLA